MSQMSRNVLIRCPFLWALLLAAGAPPALAQPAPPIYDQIDLSASAETEVANDLLVAVVYAEVQNERQSVAANEVNEAIQWAVGQAERARDVQAQTLQYASFPVYGNNRRVIAWRARQSLRLESRDAERLGELLGTLQERLSVQSVNYDVSKEARDAADEMLIADALAQFNRRATLVANELGRSGYRIVRIGIATNEQNPMPVPLAYRATALEQDTAVAAPALEAGVQTLRVTVSGTVELDPPR